MKKALIKITDYCNNRCEFCHSRDGRKASELSLDRINRKIKQIKDKAKMIVLSGGEPTIHKDFMKIAHLIKKHGLLLGLATNGRLLSSKTNLEKLKSLGLRYLYISLHSADEKIHNELTGSDSFRQTLEGIKNSIRHKDIETIVNVVVNNKNLDGLNDIVDLAKKEGIPAIKFSYIFIKGAVDESQVPMVSECWEAVRKAIDHGAHLGVDVCTDCFPLCIMRNPEKMDTLQTNNIDWVSETFEEGFFPSDYGEREHIGPCEHCGRKDECAGIYSAYAKHFGTSEFHPYRKPVANSFNYFANEGASVGILNTGNLCNLSCIFCLDKHNKSKPFNHTTQEVKRQVTRLKEKGANTVIFMGGECTIRDDLPNLIRFISSLGMLPQIVTNGIRLSDKRYLKKLIDAGLDSVEISICSTKDMATHVHGKDITASQILALKNLAASRINSPINIVVFKDNHERLIELADMILDSMGTKNKIKFKIGRPSKGCDDVWITFTECMPHIKKATRYLLENGFNDYQIEIDEVPLCLAEKYEHMVNQSKELLSETMYPHSIPDSDIFNGCTSLDFIKTEACKRCGLGILCFGIRKEYAEHFGTDEIKISIKDHKQVKNKFINMIAKEAISNDNPKTIIINDDNITSGIPMIFRTSTNDFDTATIQKVKSLEQIYLNAGQGKCSHDFRSDYRKLRYDGKFFTYGSDVFSNDEKELKRIISRMKGSVLDVGCGDSKYKNMIEDMVTRGDIRYLGIDPHEQNTNLNFQKICLEEFNTKKKYDNILLLRSISHFEDIRKNIEKCIGMLSPGGLLIVCENIPFGVVQMSVSNEKGDETRERKHYHNLFIEDFKKIISGLPLGIEYEKPVTKDSSNQWLMVLKNENRPD